MFNTDSIELTIVYSYAELAISLFGEENQCASTPLTGPDFAIFQYFIEVLLA